VLTIGYLILEAESAEITLAGGRRVAAEPIAYDHASGFGLLRAREKLGVRPIELGGADALKEHDRVMVASHGGPEMAGGALVVGRRPFAGSWEYLLERAILTAPAHPAFGGAALIGRDGKLLGIGSLIVPNAAGDEQPLPGKLFVPVDLLKPILADMLTHGRAQGPARPWLGLSTDELRGRLFVSRVSRGAPAFEAGIQPGDLVVGVNGATVDGMADFYRKVWAIGKAGVDVPLDVLQGAAVKRITVKSMDRQDWLKIRRSYCPLLAGSPAARLPA
jgi:S1-C subfamily serine protease